MSKKKFYWPALGALTALFTLAMFSTVALASTGSPSLTSDRPDYDPGSVVTLIGSGWSGDASVQLAVNDDQGKTWSWSDTVVPDVNGDFTDTLTLPTTFVAQYTATATGSPSGAVATTTFTDGNVKAKAAPSGTTFTLTKTKYVSSTDCSTGAGTPTTVTGVDFSTGDTTGTGLVESVKFQAAATSDQGGAFINWTSTESFTDLGSGAICVPGFGTGTHSYFANYGTPPPPPPSNSAPTVDAGGPYSGDEGSTIAINGASASDPDNDPLTYSWSINYNSNMDAGGSCPFSSTTALSPTISCTDDSNGGTFTLTLTVDDGNGHTASDTASLTVTNAKPTATPTVPSGNVNEGDPFSLSLGSPSDAGTNDTFTYQFDCGDGNGYNAASTTASRSCPTTDNGSRSVKLKILDDDGGYTEYTGTVTVVNVPPTVTASITSSVDCQSNATLTLSFSDPGTGDYPWTVNIDWGDNSTSSFTTNAQGSQTNSNLTHLYTTPNNYNVQVSVTDKDLGVGSDNNNPITVNQVYTVGFLQPFDASNPSKLITNTMKSGRVVPVKATIYDVCAGSYVTDPTTSVRLNVLNTSTPSSASNDAVEVYADAGASNSNTLYFRWTSDSTQPGGGFWIYNLDSRTVLNGSPLVINQEYRVDIYVGATKATKYQWALLKAVK